MKIKLITTTNVFETDIAVIDAPISAIGQFQGRIVCKIKLPKGELRGNGDTVLFCLNEPCGRSYSGSYSTPEHRSYRYALKPLRKGTVIELL